MSVTLLIGPQLGSVAVDDVLGRRTDLCQDRVPYVSLGFASAFLFRQPLHHLSEIATSCLVSEACSSGKAVAAMV
jgi:hypothetical protein